MCYYYLLLLNFGNEHNQLNLAVTNRYMEVLYYNAIERKEAAAGSAPINVITPKSTMHKQILLTAS